MSAQVVPSAQLEQSKGAPQRDPVEVLMRLLERRTASAYAGSSRVDRLEVLADISARQDAPGR